VTLVIDASVAVKWVVDEPDSAFARAVAESGEALIAPELVLAEAGNVLWRLVKTGRIGSDQAAAAELELRRAFDQLIPIAELSANALAIAIKLGHPIYDCYYLALAQRVSAELITNDGRLLSRSAASSVRVRTMASFAP
jgi:predicted nucleic acid-binding protein